MLLFAAIAFVGFWLYTIRLWVLDGPKIPLAFISVWVLSLLGVTSFGLGAHIFMGFEAILGLALIIINGYRVPPVY
ncbi:MAG: hypothetical protein JSW27_18515 [Phycisphaerales bacterium]|nr:MAG: hypothetical protein JSW27_18515 [Phycisphaerales bacterium]